MRSVAEITPRASSRLKAWQHFRTLSYRRKRQARFEGAQALGLAVVELLEQEVGVGHLEVIARILTLVFEIDVAVGEDDAVLATAPHDVEHAVDALDVHRQTLEAVGDFHGNGAALEAADLLEVGELGHFHAVDPDLPTKAPCAQRRAFPVVFDEAHVVLIGVDADGAQAAEIELLEVRPERAS